MSKTSWAERLSQKMEAKQAEMEAKQAERGAKIDALEQERAERRAESMERHPAGKGKRSGVMREWLDNAADAAPVAKFEDITLTRVALKRGREQHALAGVTARVESGSEVRKRVTATRLLGLGVVGGLILRKKSGGESWLTLDGGDWLWTVEVPRKQDTEARRFAAQVNDAARAAR